MRQVYHNNKILAAEHTRPLNYLKQHIRAAYRSSLPADYCLQTANLLRTSSIFRFLRFQLSADFENAVDNVVRQLVMRL